MSQKIVIELTIDGDADDALIVIDELLDAGAIQDAIDEMAEGTDRATFSIIDAAVDVTRSRRR